LEVTAAADIDPNDLELRLRAVVEPEFPGAEIVVLPRAEGKPGVVVEADPVREVTVLWAGDIGSKVDARRVASDLSLLTQSGDLLVAGNDAGAVSSVVSALQRPNEAQLSGIQLRGLQPNSATRRLFARAEPLGGSVSPVHVEPSLCDSCFKCIELCPVDSISLVDGGLVVDGSTCIGCHICGEFCHSQALRPYFRDTSEVMTGPTLQRLLANTATRDPKRSPPAALLNIPLANEATKPKVVLGLAAVTLMEHAAALLIDGKLVAAVEEERLTRERHYAFKAPNRPGASMASDPTLGLDEAWPHRSIDAVLRMAGLTLDDVDAVGLNGLPYRFRDTFSAVGNDRPLRAFRAGRLVFLPHHLCHAASAYGMTDFESAWILTVDGRGDCETMALYRAEADQIELVERVPFFPDHSVGGVFETITQILGFGSHGQGSTMALAALGEPTIDLSDCMSIDEAGVIRLSEWDAAHRFKSYARGQHDPIEARHRDLAASVQAALENTVLSWLEARVGTSPVDPICLAGGVGLSCRMNGAIRRALSPSDMLVPPGANDAGTAIGAALLAHREVTGHLPRIDGSHTFLGPEWDDAGIANRLSQLRIPFQRLDDVGGKTAELLAAGKIVCWFQGRMEFGPRALGGRSILADPRQPALKARLNRMKSRQQWRPFGPSILAGHQSEWFKDDWDTRFMLFAVEVRESERDKIPVVVHDDGTTRPQVVHPDAAPRYHALISAFHELTSVPMVVNTSFNTGGEPIVATPKHALRSFAKLGADCLVMGDCLVTAAGFRSRR